MQWENDLVMDIRQHSELDDQDVPFQGRYHHIEFTDANKKMLKNSFLQVRDKCKAVLEIGVHRNNQDSSTHIFLQNKNPETKYIGVDIVDKSFLDNAEENVYTIKEDSSNYDQILSYLESVGVYEIDYLFIDGWHSINQVLRDWEFTRILSKDGIVGFHDTTRHPGPKFFIENLDKDKWDVSICCQEDNGIGFARRL